MNEIKYSIYYIVLFHLNFILKTENSNRKKITDWVCLEVETDCKAIQGNFKG